MRADRFRTRVDELRARGEGLLMPFVPIGYPSLDETAPLVEALVAAGADAIELGLPFSDPIADGPVLQTASARALAAGATPARCLDVLAGLRATHPTLPIAVLTYLQLVEAPGPRAFFDSASAAGVDALVLADLPACEAQPYVAEARAAGVDCALLVAPDTPDEVVDDVAELGGGFTYVVARRGITGARAGRPEISPRIVTRLQQRSAPPPLVGFGLSTGAHLRAVMESGAAGGIVGSALVDALSRDREQALALVRDCKAGTRLARG